MRGAFFLRGIKAFVDREIGSIFLLRFLEIIKHNFPEIMPLTPLLQHEKPGLVKLLFYKQGCQLRRNPYIFPPAF